MRLDSTAETIRVSPPFPREPLDTKASISAASVNSGRLRSCLTTFKSLKITSSSSPSLSASLPFRFLNGVRKVSTSSRNLVSLKSSKVEICGLFSPSATTTDRKALTQLGKVVAAPRHSAITAGGTADSLTQGSVKTFEPGTRIMNTKASSAKSILYLFKRCDLVPQFFRIQKERLPTLFITPIHKVRRSDALTVITE